MTRPAARAPQAPTRTTRRAPTGSATVELVVLAPVVIVFVLFVVALGRYETVRAQVVGAARAGAEAAAEAGDGTAAAAAAASAAVPVAAGAAPACRHVRVSTVAAPFAPGGSVTVDVRCSVSTADLLVPGLPGSLPVSSRVRAPIDRFRSVP